MTVEYLKGSNKVVLRSYVVLNVVVFWGIFVAHADLSTIPDLVRSMSIKDGVIAVVATLGSFILDGLLSPDVKASLVYWRWNYPLPGCRAFSKHLLSEHRADPQSLIEQWGPLPVTPSDQNRLWYRIYKRVESEISVREAHRAWLLSRDLTGYAALFLVCLGMPTLIMDTPDMTAPWYVGILLAFYVSVVIAARTYGNRLVRNVLAIASNSTALLAAHHKQH